MWWLTATRSGSPRTASTRRGRWAGALQRCGFESRPPRDRRLLVARCASAQDLSQNNDVLPVLWTIGCLLRADDVGEIRNEDLDSEDVEPNSATSEIVEASGSRRSEGDVEAARRGDEVPQLGSGQRGSAAVEGQSLGDTLGVDPRIELMESRREPLEIHIIASGSDVGVCGETRESLEPRRKRPDQDIADIVSVEGPDEPLRIER